MKGKKENQAVLSVRARRAIAYLVLLFLAFLCLVWFYVLFVNATRSNNQLKTGFALLPGRYLVRNMRNLFHGSTPVVRGMLNSLLIAGLSAALSVYFSTMTAYAIHGYEFRGKKAVFSFILAIMMIPTQVTALGFIRLMASMKLSDSYIPLIVPSIAAPVTFFYLKQYMDSNLPGSLLEAARIDGAGELRSIRQKPGAFSLHRRRLEYTIGLFVTARSVQILGPGRTSCLRGLFRDKE